MSTDDQIIEKLKQASQLMKSYNWAGADELFQTILAEGPMNPNVEKFSAAVLGMRAECLFAQGKVRSVPLFSSLFFFFCSVASKPFASLTCCSPCYLMHLPIANSVVQRGN
jgi:hypothetical protein